MKTFKLDTVARAFPATAAALAASGLNEITVAQMASEQIKPLFDDESGGMGADALARAIERGRVPQKRSGRFESGKIREGLKGDLIKVILIESGMTENGDYIPKETLERAAALFENAPACAYQFTGTGRDEPYYYSHVRPETRRGVGSFVGNIIGFFSNVKFGSYEEEGRKRYALFADLHVTAQWFKDLCLEAFAVNAGKRLGLSADVEAWFVDLNIDGMTVPSMDEIIAVHEVTAVTHPAARGRLLNIAASVADYKKDLPMNKKIMQWFKDNCPELIPEIPDMTEEQEEAVVLSALEALYKKVAPSEETPAMYDDKTGEEKPADAANAETPAGAEKDTQQSAAAQRIEELFFKIQSIGKQLSSVRDEMKTDSNRRMLDKVLDSSSLPASAKARVMKYFEGRAQYSEADVIAAMREEQEYIASFANTTHKLNGQERQLDTRITSDEYDKYVNAMHGMLLNKDIGGVPRFKSLHHSYRVVTGFSGSNKDFADSMMRDALYSIPPLGTDFERWRGKLQASRRRRSGIEEAQFDTLTTSLWSEVYGDSNRRALIDMYNTPKYQDWRKIARVVPVPDFRTNRRQRIGGFDDLLIVAEGGTYTEQSWPADQEVSYAAQKRGNIQPLTWETFVNDDLNAVQRVPQMLGTAAARTLYKFVFDFIRNSPAMDYDSVALFHADHANLGSTALSDAALDDRIFAMKNQTELSSGERLGIVPRYILVPHTLSRQAWEQAKSSVSSLGARTETIENWFKEFGLEPIEVYYWDDATDWALVADPADWPTCEIGFLFGNEEPELFIQDQPLLGSVYTAEKLSFKIRHIYGGDWLDHRTADKSVVAG